MSTQLGIALYIMIWWITLFAVLPFGVRTQGEEGDVVPGTPASAPVRPRLLKAFLINTVVAAIAFRARLGERSSTIGWACTNSAAAATAHALGVRCASPSHGSRKRKEQGECLALANT